ncbi:MAG: penicillin-binding protein activator [Deltaproteobacteria bacterium]|nr:penicillin-binding protein activator [Deltaproteobacteria bacterium]
MRTLSRIAAAVTGVVLFAACAGSPGGRAPAASDEERHAYHAAKRELATDPAAAERAFTVFLDAWPRSALAPKAAALLGTIARDRGDADEALLRYRKALARFPNSEISDSLRVRIAELELARAAPEAALKVLARARLSRLPNDEKRSAYRLLAVAASDSVAKLRWLARLRVIEPDEEVVTGIDAEIDELIGGLDAGNLERAVDQIGREIPAARLELRRAMLALQAGDIARAEAAWRRASVLPQALGTKPEVDRVGDRIRLAQAEDGPTHRLPTFDEVADIAGPATAGARGTLGVVLPLSGPFAHFGEESLKGILLAAGVFGGGANLAVAPSVRLIVRDSGGRPERAAAAVRELAENPDVSAVIGPLLKGECEAAAAAAEGVEMPLITLTARNEVAEGRAHVFRIRTQPEQEIETLVDHTMGELEAQRFAILYPRDAYGRGLRGLFWDAVEDRGGHIVAVASYDPDATDFAQPIRQLVGYRLLGPEVKAALEEREEMRDRAKRLPAAEALLLREEAAALTTEAGDPLPPVVDFDAIFIPESHEKVILIAPQLAFHEAVGARLLGTSGWYDPDLVAIARRHVADALFTAHYYADSPMPFVRQFRERFVASYDLEPDAVAAQAYDAANLAIVQLAAGRAAREELRRGILELRAYPGVTGLLAMNADGNAQKRPFLLSIVRGKFKQVN